MIEILNKEPSLKNENFTLKQILDMIKEKRFIIPNFQRNFVWKNSDILNLADSIIREYPISSFLFMKAGGNLDVPGKILGTDIEIKSYKELEDYGKYEYYYVLDGQQRLTSLSEIFLMGNNTKLLYFFDLLSLLNELFPQNDIFNKEYKSSKNTKPAKIIDLIKENNQFNNINSILAKTFKREESYVLSKKNDRYISAYSIYTNNYFTIISNFINNFTDISDEERNAYSNALNAVISKINNYQIPVTKISENADLELIIRIFEKINSSGMSLNLFDLINAKSFAYFNKGLSQILNNDIKEYINKNNLPADIFNKLLEYSVKEDSYLKLSRLLNILEMINLISNNDFITNFMKSNMLKKEPTEWIDLWNKYKNKIFKFFLYFYEKGILDEVSIMGLGYFCAIFAYFDIKDENFYLEAVTKILLSGNLTGKNFSKADLHLYSYFIELAKSLTNIYGLEKYRLESYRNIKKYYSAIPLETEDICEIRIKNRGKNKKIFTIMYLIYKENVNGKGIVDLENNNLKNLKKEQIDYHHIFPLSESKSFKKETVDLIDSIANIALLASNSNRFSIKDKPFHVYMTDLFNVFSEEKIKTILDNNLLDYEMVKDYISCPSEEKIVKILKNRAENIFNIIKTYFSV